MLSDLNNCTGCGACNNVCPTDAINMKANDEGFLIPVVNYDKCINCGSCERVCSKDKTAKTTEPLIVYAARNKDYEIRKNSSSGGVFYVIGELFLKNGGIVYGVSFDDDFVVKHKRIENIEGLKSLQGSKYVQSDTGYSFRKVKEDLQKGRKVLFSGTPCQVSGLLECLNGLDKSNLTTIDILCHGVGSPLVWHDYIRVLSNSENKISDINFRNKKIGWHRFCFSYKNNRSEKVVMFADDFYCNLYDKHYILRPACFECKYSKYFHESDITIGDFWGVDKLMPDMDDNMGTSVLFLNNKKGIEILNRVDGLEKVEISKEMALKYNINSPSFLPKDRDDFWEKYNNETYDYICNNYFESSLKIKAKHLLKELLIKFNYSW